MVSVLDFVIFTIFFVLFYTFHNVEIIQILNTVKMIIHTILGVIIDSTLAPSRAHHLMSYSSELLAP